MLIVAGAVTSVVVASGSDFFNLKGYFGQRFPPFIEVLLMFSYFLALWFICERLFLRFVMKAR